jgi:hypothetical protein
MNALETLTKARELLTARERWTKGHFARTAKDERCQYDDPKAACWCLAGAIARVIPGKGNESELLYDDVYDILTDALRAGREEGPFIQWNDRPERTHGDVLALLDRAIGIASDSKCVERDTPAQLDQ